MPRPTDDIELSLEEVLKDYDLWIGLTQCESYALTHLARHPERLDSIGPGGWKLGGIQVWLRRLASGKRSGAKADLVFISGSTNHTDYLVVETEDSHAPNKVKKGRKQAETYATLLEEHLDRRHRGHGQVYYTMAAVVHGPRGPRGGINRGYKCGQERN